MTIIWVDAQSIEITSALISVHLRLKESKILN